MAHPEKVVVRPKAAVAHPEKVVVRSRAVVLPEQEVVTVLPEEVVAVLPEEVVAAAAQNDCQLLLPKIRIAEQLLPRTGRLRNAVPPVIRCLIVSLFLSALKALS